MNLAKMIDHTLLKADASREEIIKLCQEAKEYDFCSVCVNPSWVSLCAELLQGTNVKVCTVVGFPLGATFTISKSWETQQAIVDGATEIDMVINIARLKDGDYDYVENEIDTLKKVCGDKAILKVIIETCLLTKDEIVKVCKLAKNSKADFVKTSTGFSTGGATVEDIHLMRATVGDDMGVKASGGIRSKEDALAMIEAGANRIGASKSIEIVS